MNAGCFGKEFKDILMSIQAIDKLGNIVTIPGKEIKFEYRKNNLNDDLIFLSASFKGVKSESSKIKQMTEQLKKKKKKRSQQELKLVVVHLKTQFHKQIKKFGNL